MHARRLLLGRGGESIIAPQMGIPLTEPGHGGWLLINGPQAMYADGKTFITYVKDGGDVAVAGWDHSAGEPIAETLIQAAVDDDLHTSPSLIVRSDGKVVVFYNGHESAQLWMRVSTSAGDISAFETAVNLDSQIDTTSYTYPSCIELDDAFYLFFRCVPSSTVWAYSVSTDNMASWSPAATLYHNTSHNRAYLKAARSSGTRIDFLGLTEHPDNGTGAIEHFYLTDSSGTPSFFDSAGDGLSRPMTEGEATEIHSGARLSLGDVRFDDGALYVLYGIAPSAGDGRMRWGYYDEGWHTHEVTDGTDYFSAYLHGGAAFLAADELIISKDRAGTMQMYRFTTTDDGETWDGQRLTSGADDRIFPKPVPGGGPFRAVGLTGSIHPSGDPWVLAVTGYE